MDKMNAPDAKPELEGESPAGETMESLLAQQAAVSDKLESRQVTWVRVISVAKEHVLVDIGEKREGIVPLSEFLSEAADEGGAKAPSVGARIPVILSGSRRDGAALLSYRRARAELGWEAAVKAFADKARVRGQVRSAVKGGFLVDVGGVTGFLPASLADLRPVRDPKRMLQTGVRCYILELNEAKKQMVLSRKAVLEEEAGKRRDRLISELRPGEVRIGRVVGVKPEGLTVDIGGAQGFVKAADLAWGAAKPPVHARGDKLRVKVLAKPAKEGEPVVLGVKQLTANPADAIRKKYPPKTVVRGKVIEAGAAGVRLVLDDKKPAYCPLAESDPDSPVKAGEAVSAIVTGVHPDTFDVVVSIAKFNDIRDRKRVAQYLKAPKPLTLGQLLSPEQGE